MLYRKFGKTNEMVSSLGFGCMRLPVLNNQPSQIDVAKAAAILRHAIDRGVNYVDTAYPYHGTGFHQGGESEPFVAKALKDGYREKVNIATKLPSWLIKTRADMDRYLEEQLNRLETEVIDFYLLHSLNQGVWPLLKELGVREFLDQAIAAGKIRYAGFSFHDHLGIFKDIVDAYDWSFCQIQYNYLDERYQAGRKGLDYAAAKGLGVAIMEPLRGGNLIKLPAAAKAVVEQADVKRTPAEWSLRWLWNQPAVSVVLSGMNELSQVEENCRVAAAAEPCSLTAKELAIIDAVKQIYQDKVRVNCTGCGYCLPCPAGINIPAIFSAYNGRWLFDDLAESKNMYQVWTRMGARASQCVECGKCEHHCPQGIEIRKNLKAVAALFE